MKHWSIGLIVFCAVLYVAASDRQHKEDLKPSVYTTLGYGLELLLTKFDIISGNLQRVENKLQRVEDKLLSVEDKQQSMNNNLKSVEDKLQRMEAKQQSMNDNIKNVKSKLLTIENDIQEHRSRHEQSEKEVIAVLHELENQVAFNMSEVHNRDKELRTALYKLDRDVDNVHNITRQMMNTLPQMSQFTEIQQKQCSVSTKVDYNKVITSTEVTVPLPPATTTTTTRTTPKPKQPPFSSCKDVPSNVSGIYLIRVTNDSEPFQVLCEQEVGDGGWIVFQERYDGSLDFYRGWNEFRDGFGDLNEEFWLGLEKIHQITRGRKYALAVQMRDFNEKYKYAFYDAFEIGSESDQYNLMVLGNYYGNARDEMEYNKGSNFSTKDRDNDKSSRHCAQYHEGAWWHGTYCTVANLNGRYMKAVNRKSMHWYHFYNKEQGLSYSRMMIRELE